MAHTNANPATGDGGARQVIVTADSRPAEYSQTQAGAQLGIESVTFHPLAELFPLIEGEEFAEPVTNRQHGLHEPVVTQGRILDGRIDFGPALRPA